MAQAKFKYGCDVIRNKFSKKYLCWNSFKSTWYWGGKNNSEKFTLSDPRQEKLLKEIEGSYVAFCPTSEDEALIIEEPLTGR